MSVALGNASRLRLGEQGVMEIPVLAEAHLASVGSESRGLRNRAGLQIVSY